MNKYNILPIIFSFLLLVSACKKDDDATSDYDFQILEEVNNYRVSVGLSTLEHNDFIWQLAREHSMYMADNETNSNHDGIEQRYEKIIKEFGNSLKDENVSSSSTKRSAKEVVDLWLASISHKENLDGDYSITGISAIKSGDGTWYFTQIFYKQQ